MIYYLPKGTDIIRRYRKPRKDGLFIWEDFTTERSVRLVPEELYLMNRGTKKFDPLVISVESLNQDTVVYYRIDDPQFDMIGVPGFVQWTLKDFPWEK